MAAPSLLIKLSPGEHVLLTDMTNRIELSHGCYDGVVFMASTTEQLWIGDHQELMHLSNGRAWNLAEVAALVADADCPPTGPLQAWEWRMS